MAHSLLGEELQLIESIVAAHLNVIGISDIKAKMARRQIVKLNRRTLQQ